MLEKREVRRIGAARPIPVDVRLISATRRDLTREAGNLPRSAADVPPHVWEMFRAHRWPGNVRELKNAVQRPLVTPERLLRSPSGEAGAPPQSVRAGAAPSPLSVARREAADTFEREYLRAILKHTQGNVTRAAALAEVSRQMIQKLARRHGVE